MTAKIAHEISKSVGEKEKSQKTLELKQKADDILVNIFEYINIAARNGNYAILLGPKWIDKSDSYDNLLHREELGRKLVNEFSDKAIWTEVGKYIKEILENDGYHVMVDYPGITISWLHLKESLPEQSRKT